MVPNVLLHRTFGKVFFVALDILIGWLIGKIAEQITSEENRRGKKDEENEKTKAQNEGVLEAIWLFNPISINVSTRGNAESVIGALVLLTIWLIFKGKIVLSALVYGAAVHFKIYPIIFAPSLFLFLNRSSSSSSSSTSSSYFRLPFPPTRSSIIFTIVSASLFILLIPLFYHLFVSSSSFLNVSDLI